MMKLNKGDIPQTMIDMMSAGDREALGLVSSVEARREMAVKVGKIVDRAEAEIQREVEGWLRINGYWPRVPEYLDGRVPPRGWYVHLSPKGTKNNPILLDLVVLGLDGRYLEVELKKQAGRVRDWQAAILKSSGVLCRSSMEAIEVLRRWMSGNDSLVGGKVINRDIDGAE